MDNSRRKKDKGIMGLLIILAWVLFLLMAVCFYLFFLGGDKKLKGGDSSSDQSSDVSTTKFTYKTNDNLEINALISDYYTAIVKCDQDELKNCVTSPSQFDDMSYYEEFAKVIIGYSNINCYSVAGYTEDATLVYVTSNLKLSGIDSTPMDIQTFYIIKKDNEYKIYNEVYSSEVAAYIEDVQAHDDIQGLYKAVRNNVEDCKLNDDKFKEFWNTVYDE